MNPTTRKHPRTLTEAFGPYADTIYVKESRYERFIRGASYIFTIIGIFSFVIAALLAMMVYEDAKYLSTINVSAKK
jgi:hypothetical protein